MMPVISRFLADRATSWASGFRQHEGWDSFDRRPWKHPWLTQSNIRGMRQYSEFALDRVGREVRKVNAESSRFRFGLACNIANTSYQIAKILRKFGLDAKLYLHPMDSYVMSQPGWEEFDGVLPPGIDTIELLAREGITLPKVSDVYSYPIVNNLEALPPPFGSKDLFSYLRWLGSSLIAHNSNKLQAKEASLIFKAPHLKHVRWQKYSTFARTIEALASNDSSFVIQAPYLAYLSGKPYVASHMGGDIWYECSRGDALGRIQRDAFSTANFLIASNPWSYAFARRYGFSNMIYIPTILDDAEYAPGVPEYRPQWAKEYGGSFFVLSTARLDDFVKGSNIAIEGFIRFSTEFPEARLGLLGWGNDFSTYRKTLSKFGIADKVFFLPLAGKKRLIKYLRSAHCLLDQFVLGYFGFTALEALACGLPVVMRLETEQYAAMIVDGPPPVMNCASGGKISESLCALARSPSTREEVSKQGRTWFLHNSGSSKWGQSYVDVLTYSAMGKHFDFGQSPLSAPLTKDEQRYHDEELKCAPLFPNYR